MRVESLRAHLNQFPDFDGFWQGADLLVIEQNIRRATHSVETLAQLARVLDLQEREQEAEIVLSSARKLFLENRGSETTRTEARLLIEEGRHLCLAMRPNRAQNLFVQAWSIANSTHDDFFSIEAAVLLSICLPPKEQLSWLNQAIKVAERSQNDLAKLWLPHVHMLIGWISFDQRQFDQTLNYFELAKTEATLPGVRIDSVVLQWSLARCLRAQNRLPEALLIQQDLCGLPTTSFSSGFIFLELAECFQLMGELEESKEYFLKAHTELSKNLWYADNKSDELLRMKDLAKKRG